MSSSIILGKNQEGRANGLAAVLFLTEDDCKRAMFEKQGQNIGHRYVEIYSVSHLEYFDFKKS